jgi:hypothetical protein
MEPNSNATHNKREKEYEESVEHLKQLIKPVTIYEAASADVRTTNVYLTLDDITNFKNKVKK